MTINKNNEEDKNIQPPEPKPFTYFEAPTQGPKTHHFYISEGVDEPGKYIEMIHRIKMANEGDVIYIYLNTPGGRVDTGIQIISAMKNSLAHIITVLEGEVCSLGTLIFLSGDEFIVHDHCMFMIHNYSGGAYGKGREIAAQVTATSQEFGKVARSIYSPFLTDDEITRVIQGEDLWMGSDEVRSRLNKMVKIMMKEHKAALKAEKDALKN